MQMSTKGGASDKTNQIFLHIAPCGDYWTGYEVFAAKHLNPDYVKSIPIPDHIEFDVEDVLEDFDGSVRVRGNENENANDGNGSLDALLKNVYDMEDFSIIERIWEDGKINDSACLEKE